MHRPWHSTDGYAFTWPDLHGGEAQAWMVRFAEYLTDLPPADRVEKIDLALDKLEPSALIGAMDYSIMRSALFRWREDNAQRGGVAA